MVAEAEGEKVVRGGCSCLAAFQPGRAPAPVPGPGSRAAVPGRSVVLLTMGRRVVRVVRMGVGLGEEWRRPGGGRWSRLQVQVAPHPPPQAL